MPYIEFIKDNNKTNKLPSHCKGNAHMKPKLLSKQDHQIILDDFNQEKILIMMNMWKMKTTTM